MSSPIRVVAGLLTLIVITGCSSDDPATDEPTGTAAATTMEVATTTVASTTSTTNTVNDSSVYVHPGKEEVSERQSQMVEVLRRYLEAWKSKDGDMVASYMTDDAVFEYYEQDETYSVADGALQARISNGPYDSMRTFEPVMVYNNRIALTGTVDAVGVEWLSVIRFTRSGDVKIEKETLFFGP